MREPSRTAHLRHTLKRTTLLGIVALLGATIIPVVTPGIPAGAANSTTPSELPALAGSSATGVRSPHLSNDVVDGSIGLATSTRPVFTWDKVTEGGTQVEFIVNDLSTTNRKKLWSATVSVSGGKATAVPPAGKLHQGHTYSWRAVAVSGATGTEEERTFGPFTIAIDVQRSKVQPVFRFSGVDVAAATGAAVVVWNSPELSTLSGPAGFDLQWQGSNTRSPGLPEGWELLPVGSTSAWKSLQRNADRTLTLLSNAGTSLTFEQVAPGDYQPVFGAGQTWVQGGYSTLVANSDGTYTVTDLNRSVTEFSAVNAEGMSWPAKVWSAQAPSLSPSYGEMGRLLKLTDDVSGRSISFSYGPSQCGSLASGFVAVPDAMLCAVTFWDGTEVRVSYVTTPSGIQVGRLTSFVGKGELEQATDFAWDAAGRPSALRTPLVAQALASGVLPVNAQSTEALTEIAYDAQGRVTSITAPASLTPVGSKLPSSTVRGQRTFTYAPFVVRSPGTTTSAGYVEKIELSPTTMLPSVSYDEEGRRTIETWDVATSEVTKVVDATSGLITETKYDAEGRAVSKIGPTTSPGSATAPATLVSYDRDYSINAVEGTAFQGLATFYFANTTLSGTPAKAETGPLIGGTPPATYAFTWGSNPVGSGAYSARLSGEYQATAEGVYKFSFAGNGYLWIGSQACRPECSLTVRANTKIPVRIDTFAPNGSGGVRFEDSTPTRPEFAPVSIKSLSPDYGFMTAETERDYLGTPTGGTTLTGKEIYDPTTGRMKTAIQPSGSRLSPTYAPYNPAAGQFGTVLGFVAPNGAQTAITPYGATQAVSAPCAGSSAVNQGGLAKSLTDPGGANRAVIQTYDAAGSVNSSSTGPSVTCVNYDATGAVVGTSTTGGGTPVSSSSVLAVNGDPLVTSATSTTINPVTNAPEKSTARTTFNILGQAVQQIDQFGTVTTFTYDPRTYALLSITDVTAAGHRSVTNYFYRANGLLEKAEVDTKVLATYTYNLSGQLAKVIFANGATASLSYDGNGNQKSVVYQLTDGVTASESDSFSPSGRVLARALKGPDGSAEFNYVYDKNGRLTGATETGTIPVTASKWSYDYGDPSNSAGNRLGSSTTTPNGVLSTAATFDQSNQMVSTTDPSVVGPITSNQMGAVTALGGTTFSYDATGQVTKISSLDSDVSFERDISGVIGETVATPSVKASWKNSGYDLVLDAKGAFSGRIVNLSPSVSVLVLPNGKLTFRYGDLQGSAAWQTSDGVTSKSTALYDPFGQTITRSFVAPSSPPTTTTTTVTTPPSTSTTMSATSSTTTSTTPSSTTSSTSPTTTEAPSSSTSTTTSTVPAEKKHDVITNPAEAAFSQIGYRGGQTLPTATPLILMGTRTYSPLLGRFLQVDPQNSTLNSYEFAGSDPVNGADTSGNFGWQDFVSITASIVASVAAAALTVATAGAAAPWFVAFAVGAVYGAALEAVASTVVQASFQGIKQVDWAAVKDATLFGLVGGGLSGMSAVKTAAKKAAKAAKTASLSGSRADEIALGAGRRGSVELPARASLDLVGSVGAAGRMSSPVPASSVSFFSPGSSGLLELPSFSRVSSYSSSAQTTMSSRTLSLNTNDLFFGRIPN